MLVRLLKKPVKGMEAGAGVWVNPALVSRIEVGPFGDNTSYVYLGTTGDSTVEVVGSPDDVAGVLNGESA